MEQLNTYARQSGALSFIAHAIQVGDGFKHAQEALQQMAARFEESMELADAVLK